MFKLTHYPIVALVAVSLMTGLIYPLAVAGIAQGMLHRRANGSVITRDGAPVG